MKKVKKIGECLYFLIQMRLLVCLIILICSLSFAEVEGDSVVVKEDSSRKVGFFESNSIPVYSSKSYALLGMELTTWGHHVDYNLNANYNRWLANRLYLSSELFNYHILSDVGDSCTNSKGCSRIGAGIALNGVLAMASFVDAWIFGSETIGRIWFGLATLLNPTLEYYVVSKYLPISIGLGYNTDWFAFSPGHKFYLRAHGDLNVNIFFVRVAASFSYSLLDTYDLKKGSKKFYLKLILGPIDSSF